MAIGWVVGELVGWWGVIGCLPIVGEFMDGWVQVAWYPDLAGDFFFSAGAAACGRNTFRKSWF